MIKLLIIWNLLVGNIQEAPTLEIKVTNIKTKAVIKMALYKSGGYFPMGGKYDYTKEVVPNSINEIMVMWKGLPVGDYALAIYQDNNANNKIDQNFVGYPTEPFAFSNNFKPRFSAPKFNDCKFTLKNNGTLLKIKLLD